MELEEINYAEILALINLLEDNDNEVWLPVSKTLMNYGTEIIPVLEKSWVNSIHAKLQERIENIVQEIQFRNICTDLRNWDLMGANDLVRGAYIVAKMQFPDLKYDTLVKLIDIIYKEVWIKLDDNFTALEKIKILNFVIYDLNNFSGNLSNYYAPQNYYINQVLESRKGNPVSLGIIYIAVAQRLHLPVYGVNLPRNFILGYKDEKAAHKNESILFYINPFNKGSVLGKREIDFFLEQQKIAPDEQFYFPCSHYDIIERLIFNLINSYESLGQPEKIRKLQKLLDFIRR